jgi:tetratricopeptide (TPR) repeat protein
MKSVSIFVLAVFAALLIRPASAGDDLMRERAASYRAEFEKHPADDGALRRAASFSIAAGDVEQGLALSAKVAAAEPDIAAFRVISVVVAVKRNDCVEARSLIAHAPAAPLSSIILTTMDAWCAAGTGKVAEGQSILTNAGSKYPQGRAMFQFHEGLLADFSGDMRSAEDLYRKSLAADPTLRAAEAYGRLLERSGRLADAEALYAKFRKDSHFAAMAEAVELGREPATEKANPLVPSARDGVAEVLFTAGASLSSLDVVDGAALFLQLAVYLRPDHRLAAKLLEEKRDVWRKWDVCKAGNDESSVKACTALLDMPRLSGKDIGQIYAERGKSHSNAQAYEAALADVNRALEYNPKNLTMLVERGSIYIRLDRFAEAIPDLDAAVAMAPNAMEPYNNRGLARMNLGDMEGALDDYNKALSLDPNDYVALSNRGNCYAALGDQARAMADFDASIKLKPDFPSAYIGRAALKEAMGDRASADDDRAKARAIDPNAESRRWTGVRSP